jgi:hypothetical protein
VLIAVGVSWALSFSRMLCQMSFREFMVSPAFCSIIKWYSIIKYYLTPHYTICRPQIQPESALFQEKSPQKSLARRGKLNYNNLRGNNRENTSFVHFGE